MEQIRNQQNGTADIGQQLLEYVNQLQAGGRNEEEKKEYEQRIYAKVQSGQKLTPEEMSYLARNNPALYQKALRAQLMRQALENQLKHCSSKQEADAVYTAALSSVSEKDPDRDIIIAALNNAYREFRESPQYKNLPETEAEAEKQKGKAGPVQICVNESGYQEAYLPETDKMKVVLKA